MTEKNWYETEADGDRGGWYAPLSDSPAPAPSRKPHSPWKAAALVLGLLLLLVSSCLFFRRDGEGEEPESPDRDFAFQWDFGRDGAPSLPDGDKDGFADSFQDFFQEYYSSVESAEPCDIPTVEAPEGLSIELRETREEELSLQEIYRRCSPFIVAVSAYPDESSDLRYSWGTGVVLTRDGYIVTNSHVVEGACRARVTLQDDREFEARLVGNDSRSDIAVLKIEANDLTPAEFGRAATLQVGDSVVALGNPLGDSFRCTMTDGIITGIGRDISYHGATPTLLQTNAAINEGNSGGALINSYGQVVGITNMKMSNTYAGSVTIEGVGFAIPSETVKDMADALLRDGAVLGRPALGITVGAIPEDAAEHYDLPDGLYVSAVSEGSDCKAKGIRVGDVLTHANGKPLSVTGDLVGMIADMTVGDTLTLTVFRDGESFETVVALVDVNDVY